MKRLLVSLVVTVAVASLVVVGCSQAAPAPAPTKAPAPAPAAPTAAPTKAAAQPTKAAAQPTKAAAQPTAAPKVNWPEKGKTITYIVPFSAGGATDLAARALAPVVEKELGVSVQVVDKPGASSQVAITELAKSKPDGYTMLQFTTWTGLTTYMDPERKAAYSRKDLAPVALLYETPYLVTVGIESPYKSLKDVIDAAKAAPGKLKIGTTGRLGMGHLTGVLLAKQTGVEFASVHFNGGAPQMVALLGGHIDVGVNPIAEVMSPFKSGQLRVLAVTDNKTWSLFPDVKPVGSLGYKEIISVSTGGVIVPAGTPAGVVDALAGSLKKALDAPVFQKLAADYGYGPQFAGPAEYGKFWDREEATVKPILEIAKKDQ